MEIDLDPAIEKVVGEKVARGEYPSVAALVEEALFLLVERDWKASQDELIARLPQFDPPGEVGPAAEGGDQG